MTSSDEILFHEEQRPWAGFKVITGACCTMTFAICGYVLILYFFYLKPVEAGSKEIALLIFQSLAIVLSIAGLLVTFMTRMTIDLRRTGLYVRFRPVHLRPRKIDLNDLVSVKPVEYRPVAQYGGWGIRRTIKGKAYNMRGNRGVRLDYATGRHLLLGSQRPEELAAAIENFRSQK